MQLPPLEVLASFPAPNYVDPIVRGRENVIMNVIFYPLVLLMMAIRIYTRLRISKSFGADDYLICAALIPGTAFSTIGLLAELHFGWNRHVWDVPVPNLILGLKFFLITQIIFTLCQSLTKLSMLALIYRIMAVAGGRLKILTEILSVVILLEAAIFIITVIFQCRPPRDYWTLTFEPQPNCINQNAHVLAAGIINTCTDFLVVCLPLPTVLKLRLPQRQVIIISLLFAAGGIASIAGGVRTYYTYLETSGVDSTWAAFPVWLSGSVELYVGMIGACVPATKPFFQLYIPRLLDSRLTSGQVKSNPHTGYSKSTRHPDSQVLFRKDPYEEIKLGGVKKNNVLIYEESSIISRSDVTDTDLGSNPHGTCSLQTAMED